jgi:monothiol glutaredoxin
VNDALKDRIEKMLKGDRVVLFMKGTPRMPMCGFSAATVEALEAAGAKFTAYNILEDADLRQGLKEYSNWPTYPQLYVDGELVGGSDIVRDLHQRGELATMVKK